MAEKCHCALRAFPVCEDDIAIILHKNNPLLMLTPDQLLTIACQGDAITWGQFGAEGNWAKKSLTLHGRDDKSGTQLYLQQLVGGPQREQKTHDSDRALVEAVAADETAIGFTRADGVDENVKAVLIGPQADGTVRPTIRRPCMLVVPVGPAGQPVQAIREFLTFVYRLDGQSLLARDGFVPLSKERISIQLENLGIEEIK